MGEMGGGGGGGGGRLEVGKKVLFEQNVNGVIL